MTITTLSIVDNIYSGLTNFYNVAVDYLEAIFLAVINLFGNVAMLTRFAWNFFTVPALLSSYFIAPIAISGGFMVVVGIVKLIFGRDAQ